MEPKKLHPSIESLLQFFSYSHLPEKLRAVSEPFCHLAHRMVGEMQLDGPEAAAGLRKLLEAKDCAVRAALSER